MMDEWLGFVAGLAIVLGTFTSVLDTLVVPRARPARSANLVVRLVRGIVLGIARMFRAYEGRDRVLALAGPAALVTMLGVWLGALVVGYGLMLWPLIDAPLGTAIRASGSSTFTLGYDQARGAGETTLSFLAAGSGLALIALQIAYLPTIYGAFNRRETLVTLLESRAGVPAWGPELLWRHQRVGITETLPALYAEWEVWAAELAETHSSYPGLVYFRSPRPLRSWVTSLLAVLDSAAMYLALAPSTAPTQARLCLRMGFSAVRDLAETLGIAHDPDPLPDAPIALTFEEFAHAAQLLGEEGFPLERDAAEAWPDFRGWRVNYEGVIYQLADLVVAPPAMWSGPRRHVREGAMPVRRPVDRRLRSFDDPNP